jgi:hypothetical protein
MRRVTHHNASNSYTLSKDELKEIRNIIKKGIKIDEEEDKRYGERRVDELPPDLNTQEKTSDGYEAERRRMRA